LNEDIKTQFVTEIKDVVCDRNQ